MIPMRFIPLVVWLILVANLAHVVRGWSFRAPPVVREGGNTEFGVSDDGGGFSYPYTMTILRKVLGQPEARIDSVQTDIAVFYWVCNQPPGTVLEFRLFSRANVNYATSGNMTVQPGLQGYASSVSVASLLSQSTSATTQAPSASAGSETQNSGGVSSGVIAGVTIAAVLVLLALLVAAWWAFRHKRSQITPEQDINNNPEPFGPSRSQPFHPIGYVTPLASPYEDPPQYTPPSELREMRSQSETTYPSTSMYSETNDSSQRVRTYAPVQSGKRRNLVR